MTNGHVDVIARAAGIFDRVVVGVVGKPQHKEPMFTVDERVEFLRGALASLDNVEIDVFRELVVDFARRWDAKAIVKGLRVISDFEWEFQMNQLNRTLAPEVETVYVMASPQVSFVSSSGVKEIAAFGGDVSELVPEPVRAALQGALPRRASGDAGDGRASDRARRHAPRRPDAARLRRGRSGRATSSCSITGRPEAASAIRPTTSSRGSAASVSSATTAPATAVRSPNPGRSVADVVADIEDVLDELEIERLRLARRFRRLPALVRAAAPARSAAVAAGAIAAPTPYPAEGLDWLAGMGEDNIVELNAALAGPEELEAYLEARGRGAARGEAEEVKEVLATLLPPVDRAVLDRGPCRALEAEQRPRARPGHRGLARRRHRLHQALGLRAGRDPRARRSSGRASRT